MGRHMSWSKEPCVYILASRRDGVLYIGVSSAVWDRVSEHKQKLIEGFTKKYGVEDLVYLEFHDTMEAAIRREKQLKKWNRAWKVRLIEQMNPEWRDLWSPTGEIFPSGVGGQAESAPTEAPYFDERGSPPSRG
jgi:putative endonuclease